MTELNQLLIVDQDYTVGDHLRIIAESLGIPSQAIDGYTCCHSLEALPDSALIALDINNPQVNEVDILSRLAKKSPQATVLLISGNESRLLRNVCNLGNELGVNMVGFLRKPLDEDRLIHVLNHLMQLPNVH